MKREDAGIAGLRKWFSIVIGPDGNFVWMAVLYGIGISLLWLAAPLSVQLLINSVAAVDLATPLISLAGVLLVILTLLAILIAARLHLIALLERRLYTRIVAEITMRTVHARKPFFEDERKHDLFNRYFDMIMAEKSLPSLLIGLFAYLLEGSVGLIVTSFYHPYIFAFNAVLVVVLLVIWRFWAHEAIWTAVQQSEAKHRTAHWIQTLASSGGFFKSGRHIGEAYAKSEELSARWVDTHKRHFRQYFSQSIAFLATFAIANSGFLALGGALILSGQLSLGQLVAAELILSGIFYGIAQITTYLPTLYEFAANLEETTRFWHIEQEEERVNGTRPADGALAFRKVSIGEMCLDFSVAAGEQLAVAADAEARRAISRTLKRLEGTRRGIVMVGGRDIADYDLYHLRSDVMVFDRAVIVEMSIREYLDLAAAPEEGEGRREKPGRAAYLAYFEALGLDDRIEQLDDGLDTVMANTGWPLAPVEVLALKLVGALIARPRLLLLSPLYDLLPVERLDAALAILREEGTTVLQFTRRPEGLKRDGLLWIGADEQRRFASTDEIDAVIGKEERRALVA